MRILYTKIYCDSMLLRDGLWGLTHVKVVVTNQLQGRNYCDDYLHKRCHHCRMLLEFVFLGIAFSYQFISLQCFPFNKQSFYPKQLCDCQNLCDVALMQNSELIFHNLSSLVIFFRVIDLSSSTLSLLMLLQDRLCLQIWNQIQSDF